MNTVNQIRLIPGGVGNFFRIQSPALLALTLSVLLTSCDKVAQSAQIETDQPVSPAQVVCDARTALSVGQLYYGVNPYFELTRPRDVETFIRQNAALLSANSAVIHCAAIASERLKSFAHGSFDARAADDAYAMAIAQGATMEQANDVRRAINRDAIGTLIVAEELEWLAEVIPHAAFGDYGPFTRTGTDSRRMFRQAWPMYQELLRADPSNKVLLDSALSNYQGWLIYAIGYMVFTAAASG